MYSLDKISETDVTNKARLDEIIELGREALRRRRSYELALSLLSLDGVQLPLDASRRTD